MRKTQALFVFLIPLLMCMLVSPLYSNGLLYGEEQITVDGQVDFDVQLTVEGKVNGPSRLKLAQDDKNTLNDTVQWRKRRQQNNYQTPPEETKKSISINVEARAYCLGGFTSRGTPTRVGAVAVDPRIIPLGSKIYIPGYGWGTALDTGGAIKGNSIDIWMPTYSQCMQWGVREITIKVVKP